MLHDVKGIGGNSGEFVEKGGEKMACKISEVSCQQPEL